MRLSSNSLMSPLGTQLPRADATAGRQLVRADAASLAYLLVNRPKLALVARRSLAALGSPGYHFFGIHAEASPWPSGQAATAGAPSSSAARCRACSPRRSCAGSGGRSTCSSAWASSSSAAAELGSITLTPDTTGGVFEVRVDGKVIWSRKERGRFPEI